MALGVPALCVLVAAGRAAWEPATLRDLGAQGVVVLRRCVDLDDLLATALQGQADAALVSSALAGVDADALRRLEGAGVRLVAVAADPVADERMHRLGVSVCGPDEVVVTLRAALSAESTAAQVAGAAAVPLSPPGPAHRGEGHRGQVVAVWGPAGAPGRTTIAMALAAERAAAPGTDLGVLLCDLDPYAGTVAQQLGVVEEVSGLLAVARLANEGALDHGGLVGAVRTLTPRLHVLTGLPRAERWREVREGVVERLVELAATEADVVLDCGFALEPEPGRTGLSRNVATLEALQAADRVVVVGSAEPAALTRLARALVALNDVVAGPPVVTVVNRMRDSLGWRPADVEAMVEGFAPGVPVHFWPEQRELLDRAMVAGSTLAEMGEHSLRACARALVSQVFGPASQPPKRR